ncbi:MAG TPA: hypothetical protein VMV08_02160 [Gaiellaceae bacterium]|nr:hypothetical protein [Gaiellaceae bacterium]
MALKAKVTTFEALVGQTGENSLIKRELRNCAPFESKTPPRDWQQRSRSSPD